MRKYIQRKTEFMNINIFSNYLVIFTGYVNRQFV